MKKLIYAESITESRELAKKIDVYKLTPYLDLRDLIVFVDYLPPAYDVDKVIEELKSKAFTAGEESDDDGCYIDSRFSAVPLDVAIDIVKRGGVNDRVREREGN